LQQLIERAKTVIQNNWREGFTVPSENLYPFQWMWDSGFVALGTSHYDLEKAIQEIECMFSGQWENGMIPHIIFHSENETSYFPNFDFWDCSVNDGAPQKPKTSGITQPAVFGFILEAIYDHHKDNAEVVSFVKRVYPKVVKYHRFLYDYRDPFKEGLFFIYHPWESGRDNSPIWDESLNRIVIDKNLLPDYQRRDTSIADASERPTSYQYDRYVYLLELGKKYKYDGPEIAEHSPFLVQDCMMNAILIKSNQALIKLGNELGLDVSYIEAQNQISQNNFVSRFWNEDLGTFVSYDLRAGKQIAFKEIGGFISLFAKLANETQADRMISYLQKLHNDGYYLCPSFDVNSELFDSKRYWRGPIWPHMNSMIYHGLKYYNQEALAEIVKSDTVQLVDQFGFYEYYESQKHLAKDLSKGYGGNNFSWTSSSIIHLLSHS